MNDQFVEKIRKLLALSTSSNKNEAESALAKARALSLEKGIDLALVNVEKPDDKYNHTRVGMGQRLPVTAKYSFWILKDHFGVRIIQSGGRATGRSIVLLGKEEDVEIAKYVMDLLIKRFLTNWREDQKKFNLNTKNRESYLYGQWQGLHNKLNEEAERVKREKFSQMPEGAANQYAMVLVSDEKKIQSYVETIFPVLRNIKGRSLNLNSATAINLGKEAGAKIQINRALNNSEDEVLTLN